MPDYYATNYSDAVAGSLQDLYARFLSFLPNFLVAVIVLIVGWVVASFVAKLLRQVLHSARLDELGDKLGLDQLSARTGMKLNVSGAIAWVVKWFVLIAIFLAAADILGLTQVSEFLNQVLLYIPNVVVAALILVIAALVADTVEKLVRGTVEAAGY